MNSDTQPTSTSKYEKLGKGRNTEVNRRNNPNNLQVTDTRQICNNPNRIVEQKPDSSLTFHTSSSSTKHLNVTAGKYQAKHKLVNSKQVLGSHQFDKKAFLLDTYACIVASNNRRCPKRLRELAKPKRQASSDQNDYAPNFDLNYGHRDYFKQQNSRDIQKDKGSKGYP